MKHNLSQSDPGALENRPSKTVNSSALAVPIVAAVAPPTKRPARRQISAAESRKVWVRAGGTCVLCKRYLLEGTLTGREMRLGELAHVVGQQNSPRSPRGQNPMPVAERDLAENLILACENCHQEIDDLGLTSILDVKTLYTLKAQHEKRIKHVTTLPDDQRTLVLRVVGKVRGNAVAVTRATVATTVLRAGRFPWFDLDRERLGVEVDLRSLPGELYADASYFANACKAVDEVLDHKVHDAVMSGAVRHISVFAFARLPVLIYLGTRLEDNCTVEVYQRHRDTQQWAWDDDTARRNFTVGIEGALEQGSEAVLILNISGSIDRKQCPAEFADMPLFVVTPDGTPSPDIIRSRSSLDSFCKAVREVNANLDAHKNLKRLHVFGALPPSAAVEFGRLHDPHIHPILVIHDRTNDGAYRVALELA